MCMSNITLYVPEKVKERMDRHSDIRWSEVVRRAILEKLKEMIGNPGITVSGLEYKTNLRVLDIGLFSHSLELNQLEKGVDVYYNLIQVIRNNTNAYGDLKKVIEGMA